jgi:hypothetical protein
MTFKKLYNVLGFKDDLIRADLTLLEGIKREEGGDETVQVFQHVENPYNFTVVADGQHDIAELLEEILGNWIDFVFVPSPQLLAIYADHDEYTTFYTPNEAGLQLLTTTLEDAGFQAIVNYTRGAAENRWQ